MAATKCIFCHISSCLGSFLLVRTIFTHVIWYEESISDLHFLFQSIFTNVTCHIKAGTKAGRTLGLNLLHKTIFSNVILHEISIFGTEFMFHSKFTNVTCHVSMSTKRAGGKKWQDLWHKTIFTHVILKRGILFWYQLTISFRNEKKNVKRNSNISTQFGRKKT